MKKVLILVAVIVLAVVGWMVLGKDSDKLAETTTQNTNTSTNDQAADTNAEEQTPASENNVTISNFAFSPAKITVKVGTTVTWTNQDTMQHNVEPDEASDDFKRSEMLAKGETYSFTFNKAGTYGYHCQPHPQMKGTVEVTE